jgi:hypothetical protein
MLFSFFQRELVDSATRSGSRIIEEANIDICIHRDTFAFYGFSAASKILVLEESTDEITVVRGLFVEFLYSGGGKSFCSHEQNDFGV